MRWYTRQCGLGPWKALISLGNEVNSTLSQELKVIEGPKLMEG